MQGAAPPQQLQLPPGRARRGDEGFGNVINSITLDGQPLAGAAVPASLTGRHAVRIVLSSVAPAAQAVNRVADAVAPETPAVTLANRCGHACAGASR